MHWLTKRGVKVMTIDRHPITPPPELVQQWTSLANEGEGYEVWSSIALWAAQWGADTETLYKAG